MRQYFVYILTTRFNQMLYVGVTNNLERRVYEHKNKFVSGYTKRYNVTKLVYFEVFTSPDEAIAAEKKIKGWTREKKNKLITLKNPDWEEILL